MYCGKSCQKEDWYDGHVLECIGSWYGGHGLECIGRNYGKFHKVMREFKSGTLHSSSGELVTSRKQALAIAYSESK